jgi:hypothetical protein
MGIGKRVDPEDEPRHIKDPNKRCKWFYEDKDCSECALATNTLQDNGFIALRVTMKMPPNRNCLGNLSACHYLKYQVENLKRKGA